MSLSAPGRASAPPISSVDAGVLADASAREAATHPGTELIELFRRRKILMAPLLVLAAFVVIGVLAPYLAPRSPTETALGMKLTPPAWLADGVSDRPLGTDQLGRDIASRIIRCAGRVAWRAGGEGGRP